MLSDNFISHDGFESRSSLSSSSFCRCPLIFVDFGVCCSLTHALGVYHCSVFGCGMRFSHRLTHTNIFSFPTKPFCYPCNAVLWHPTHTGYSFLSSSSSSSLLKVLVASQKLSFMTFLSLFFLNQKQYKILRVTSVTLNIMNYIPQDHYSESTRDHPKTDISALYCSHL